MLRRIIGHPSHMGLHDMVSVEIGHLAIRLDPHLELCMLSDMVEGGDVQLELSGLLGELAEAGADGEELVARDGGGETGDRFADVVDSVALQTKDVWVVRAVY